MSECCDIFEKFDVENNLVKEYENWVLVVRKNHVCLGSCVAITKKHHDLLGELSSEEMAEYQVVAKDIENALAKAFQFEVIQHMVLMVKDKHTHFHIFPRYQATRNFAGLEWIDDIAGTPPFRKQNLVSQDVLNQVRDNIKQEIA